MIPAKKIIQLVRYKQKDNNEIKFSDYDIIQALNECIRYINQRFAMQNSDFLEKVHVFDEKEINESITEHNSALIGDEEPTPFVDFNISGIELPEDFLTLVSLVNNSGYTLRLQEAIKRVNGETYKIVDNKLFTGATHVVMLYRASIAGVGSEKDVVYLPELFLDGIVKCTGMILNNTADTDVMEQAVDANIVGLVSARRYSNSRVKMPFYC